MEITKNREDEALLIFVTDINDEEIFSDLVTNIEKLDVLDDYQIK